jgi:hypothetical protein
MSPSAVSATLERWQLRRDLEQALEQRDRARALACRLEEELALIRRAAHERRTRV